MWVLAKCQYSNDNKIGYAVFYDIDKLGCVTVNAAQGYQLMAELKKARRKRREAKDAKLLIEIAMSHRNNNDWGHGRLETAIEQLDSRQFTPKVRNDLFEKN